MRKLDVPLSDDETAELEAIAAARGLSLEEVAADYVRARIRLAREEEGKREENAKCSKPN